MDSTRPEPTKANQLAAGLWTIVLLPYSALCLAAYVFQKRLLFLPTTELVADPGHVELDFDEVWIETGQERVHGWYVPQHAARASVLFLHGNSGNISQRLDTLQILHRLGLAVLIFDYPGYGNSTGSADETSCDRAARAALGELDRRTACEQPILVWGRSLGGGVGSALVDEPRVKLLILESSFSSLPVLVKELYPWLPARVLTRLKFNSAERLRQARQAVLVIHSPDDQLIGYSHARALLAAAGERGTLVTIEGGHGNGFMESGRRYIEPIDAFLTKNLAQTPD